MFSLGSHLFDTAVMVDIYDGYCAKTMKIISACPMSIHDVIRMHQCCLSDVDSISIIDRALEIDVVNLLLPASTQCDVVLVYPIELLPAYFNPV